MKRPRVMVALQWNTQHSHGCITMEHTAQSWLHYNGTHSTVMVALQWNTQHSHDALQ